MEDENKNAASPDELVLDAEKWWTERKKKYSKWISGIIAAIGVLISMLSYASDSLQKLTDFSSKISVLVRDVQQLADNQKQIVADWKQHRQENREDFHSLQREVSATREDVAEVKAMMRGSKATIAYDTIKITQKGND